MPDEFGRTSVGPRRETPGASPPPSSCPNCDILRTRVDDLAFEGPDGADAEGGRKLQLAEVYVTALYRARSSGHRYTSHQLGPQGVALLRVLRAHGGGVGVYAPVTFESKLCITVLTIPGIAVFGTPSRSSPTCP